MHGTVVCIHAAVVNGHTTLLMPYGQVTFTGNGGLADWR